jgi:N-acetylmuramoyl-L-alanine amidase
MIMLCCVDPGHGGNDPGAIGITGVQEKVVALNIATYAAYWLARCGVQYVLTRDGDKYVSLQERCDIANSAAADCFVSVHCNSATNPNAQGLEVYYYESSTDGRKLADTLNANIYHDCNSPSAVTCPVKPGTAPDIELDNRGSKEARFYVLRYTKMPAALVETGFLSNVTEEAWLEDTANQKLAGRAIAKAICQYLGVKWINEWEEQRESALRKLAAKVGFNSPHETAEQVDMGMMAVIFERLGLI